MIVVVEKQLPAQAGRLAHHLQEGKIVLAEEALHEPGGVERPYDEHAEEPQA